MALYSKEQLAYERSIGLILSDYDNENFFNNNNEKVLNWSKEQFESWLSTKTWTESNKKLHRNEFQGQIVFHEKGGFSYPE